MALFARREPSGSQSPLRPATPTEIRDQMAEYWGYGPRARVDLHDIAEAVRGAGLTPAQLGALWSFVPRSGGTIGQRCEALRQMLAGLEKEMR